VPAQDFRGAKEQALELLASKPRSQRAQVIALGGQLQLLTQPTSDSDLLKSALESIQVTDGHGNLGDLGKISPRAQRDVAWAN